MRINVPPRDRMAFWRLAPSGRICWLWKVYPDCKVGDELLFTVDRKVVASALCSDIFRQGRQRWWRVCWNPESWEDLRDEHGEGFEPRYYGGYNREA